jgi:cytochrome c-type biogenesis protein CcmH/NrfG
MRDSRDSDCFGSVRALQRRDFFKRAARRLALLVVVAAIAFGGYYGYNAVRKRQLSQQAGNFFAHKDYQNAALAARQLLQLDPKNVAACRILAETADLADQRDALSWREQVAALEPGAATNQIPLARAAVRFGELDLARKTLDAIDAPDRANVEYHQLAGDLAIAEKKTDLAEKEFVAALRFEPDNHKLRLSLAVVQIASSDSATQEKARAELAHLAEESTLRLEALRALTSDALANKSVATAEKWAAQLRSEKGATFADVLLYVEANNKTESGSLALHDAEKDAAHSPRVAAALINWMNRHEMARTALDWALGLPKDILNAQPVPLAVAQAYGALQDWNGMQAWVDGKNWGNDEFLRLAVVSRGLHHLAPGDGASMQSQTAWTAALKATNNRPERLTAIAQLAEEWNYPDQAADALWLVANGNDQAKEALVGLQRLYKTTQNSLGLLRVAKRAFELNPADLVAANNCASLGLLLTGDSAARRLATKLHSENPTNAACSSTYAFALFTEGRPNDALREMERLKDAPLHHPTIAAYYFVMLVESGKMERAHSYLSAANKAQLLPEEQQLLTAATRKLLQHDSQNVMKTAAADNN